MKNYWLRESDTIEEIWRKLIIRSNEITRERNKLAKEYQIYLFWNKETHTFGLNCKR